MKDKKNQTILPHEIDSYNDELYHDYSDRDEDEQVYKVSKTIRFNWDTALEKWFRKLFRR